MRLNLYRRTGDESGFPGSFQGKCRKPAGGGDRRRCAAAVEFANSRVAEKVQARGAADGD